MILAFEILMLATGLYCLITGKLTLSKSRVVYGATARIVGLILMLPLPLLFFFGLTGIVSLEAIGYLELFLLIGCLVVAIIVGYATAKPHSA